MNEASKRRWFQVTLREIALVVTAIGFALAWLGERKTSWPVRAGVEYLRSVSPASVYGHSVAMECEVGGLPLEVTVSRRTDDSAPASLHTWPAHKLSQRDSSPSTKP